MKISFVIGDCNRKPGGGYKVIYEYANFLAAHGHEVKIYFNWTSDVYKKITIPTRLQNLYKAFLASRVRPQWFKLDRSIVRKGVNGLTTNDVDDGDIIIATAVQTANLVYSLPASKGRKAYFIQDFEKWVIPDELYIFDTYGLGMSNITVAQWLNDLVEKQGKCKSTLVSNGINLNVFKCESDPTSRNPFSVCFQYRKNEKKGCKFLIDALAALKEKYPELEVETISSEPRNSEIPEWFHYHYNVKPYLVNQINNRCAIFVCPSLFEGFGLPGLEAMACGCAVITTNSLGSKEYAVNNENAIVVEPGDARVIQSAIEKLINNSELRERIARKGIETAKSRSFLKSAELFEKVLCELK